MGCPMKIANGGGFWGDEIEASFRLVSHTPDLDYLTLDYLAELSMAIMAIQKAKDPSKGYAEDFLKVLKTLKPLWDKGLKFKIVTNAGGLNPEGLKTEIEKLFPEKKVVALSGDDVTQTLLKDPENALYKNLDNGKSLTTIKDELVTANAYLGADKIAKALQEGAQIVVTGRIADPSLVVGAAIAHFGWNLNDYDKIAQATVAGHLIECGAQVTGGISGLWDKIKEPENLGFPLIDMKEDGSFIVTKPNDLPGFVTPFTVKEQLLYEIGNPGEYKSPDAIVSFLSLELEDKGDNRVQVTGAKGNPPPNTYKVSAVFKAGYKAEGTLLFSGEDAQAKARDGAEMILKRAPVQESLIETFGERQECLLRLAAADLKQENMERFARSFAPLVTQGPPGTSGYTGGRPKVRPRFGFWPCLIDRRFIDAEG
ncbi:MAG: DUF1446 domain-containing protein [Chlamydiia bacterium]|nr:DUF1446 domain-containing protein [Chlamydiia bacterium]